MAVGSGFRCLFLIGSDQGGCRHGPGVEVALLHDAIPGLDYPPHQLALAHPDLPRAIPGVELHDTLLLCLKNECHIAQALD